MAIVRYQSNPLRTIFDELEDMMTSSFDLIGRQVGQQFPSVDIVEESDLYKIKADLPGMTKDDIQINVNQGTLTISGSKKNEVEKRDKERYYHFERSYGEFSRSFNLPSNVDSEHIDAHFRNGVLEIELRKIEEAKPKSIEIKVE